MEKQFFYSKDGEYVLEVGEKGFALVKTKTREVIFDGSLFFFSTSSWLELFFDDNDSYTASKHYFGLKKG